jgi:mono/diheme cytochrome c family protein
LVLLAVAGIAGGCKSDEPTGNNNTTVGDTARGAYLVKHVAVCGDCHTPMDQTGQPIAGKELAGGQRFDLGPTLGVVYSKNITPDSATGIGMMTDEQIIKAIRTGIAEHMHTGGHMETDTLVVMPYQYFANMSDSDVKAIVAYLRYSVKAVSNQVTEDTVKIPRFLFPNFVTPNPTTVNATTTHGKYLVTIGLCVDCHTPTNPTTFQKDMTKFLAGGEPFELPFGTVYTLNLTPDDSTGLGKWTDAQINTALTTGIDDEGQKLCPPMPWPSYKGMTQADRDAVIAYLRAIPPIVNKVPDKTAVCQ